MLGRLLGLRLLLQRRVLRRLAEIVVLLGANISGTVLFGLDKAVLAWSHRVVRLLQGLSHVQEFTDAGHLLLALVVVG